MQTGIKAVVMSDSRGTLVLHSTVEMQDARTVITEGDDVVRGALKEYHCATPAELQKVGAYHDRVSVGGRTVKGANFTAKKAERAFAAITAQA